MNDLLAGFLCALMLKLTLWSMQHMTSIYSYCLTGDSRWNICCNLFYLPCPSVRAYSITICHESKSASNISSSFPNYLMSFNLFLRKYIWHSSRLSSILSRFVFKCADRMEIVFFLKLFFAYPSSSWQFPNPAGPCFGFLCPFPASLFYHNPQSSLLWIPHSSTYVDYW